MTVNIPSVKMACFLLQPTSDGKIILQPQGKQLE